MKVVLIEEWKERFMESLAKKKHIENAFYFEVVRHWQNHWNVEAKCLYQVYDQSLQSKKSTRLWGGTANSPKERMKFLLEQNENFMRAAFRDLFDEKKDLGLRLKRFSYHCQQVFIPLQKSNPKLIDHLHNQKEILCLYLSLEYPHLYCLWNYKAFCTMMHAIGSTNIPKEYETLRYYKSCRGIRNLLVKDQEFNGLLENLTDGMYQKGDLMVMALYMEFINRH